jgi:hypothetical protein
MISWRLKTTKSQLGVYRPSIVPQHYTGLRLPVYSGAAIFSTIQTSLARAVTMGFDCDLQYNLLIENQRVVLSVVYS